MAVIPSLLAACRCKIQRSTWFEWGRTGSRGAAQAPESLQSDAPGQTRWRPRSHRPHHPTTPLRHRHGTRHRGPTEAGGMHWARSTRSRRHVPWPLLTLTCPCTFCQCFPRACSSVGRQARETMGGACCHRASTTWRAALRSLPGSYRATWRCHTRLHSTEPEPRMLLGQIQTQQASLLAGASARCGRRTLQQAMAPVGWGKVRGLLARCMRLETAGTVVMRQGASCSTPVWCAGTFPVCLAEGRFRIYGSLCTGLHTRMMAVPAVCRPPSHQLPHHPHLPLLQTSSRWTAGSRCARQDTSHLQRTSSLGSTGLGASSRACRQVAPLCLLAVHTQKTGP